MRNRRLTITGLAVIAMLGLTACDPSDPGASPTASATATTAPIAADAATELAAAATKLTKEKSVKVRVSMGAFATSASGVATGDGSKVAMRLFLGVATDPKQGPPTITLRKIGDDVWMQLAGPLASMLVASTGKWLHLDVAQLAKGSTVTTGNPADAAKMINSAATVTKTGDTSFKGVLDVTNVPGLAQKTIAGLGAKATAVPFTAQTDLKGRLVQLIVDMGAVSPGAGKMGIAYSDFGTPVTVEAPPAAQVTEMPKELLSLVNA